MCAVKHGRKAVKMQITGIVRKLDDLGRVTIPQSLKKRLRISTGDLLEVFLLEDGVLFKKYCALGNNELVRKCCNEFTKVTKKSCYVVDKEGVPLSGTSCDSNRCVKNRELFIDIMKSGATYNGFDNVRGGEWITVIPLGDRGVPEAVLVAVHGKKEDPALKPLLDYTTGLINAHMGPVVE
jgi:AbrB family looped-hinge helix DNA binding protein